jgi:hypothetical protein
MIQLKTIFLIFSFSILFTSCKKGNENPEAKAMLSKFYKSYISEVASSRDLKQMEIRLDSLKKKYCTKSLIDSINVEFEDGLDYDPFINSQDADSKMLETLSVTYIKNSRGKYLIKYKNNFSNSETKIQATVVDENGKFKISSLN